MAEKGHLEASGFPFQLAVEHSVRVSTSRQPWLVASREVPWHDSGSTKHVDLALRRPDFKLRLLIECKRYKNPPIFIRLPSNTHKMARLRWSYRGSDGAPHGAWSDFFLEPEMHTSEFCVIPGGASQRLIEVPAAELARASDEFAAVFVNNIPLDTPTDDRVAAYLPILVLASPRCALLDPATVDLRDGTMPGDVIIEDARWLHFRKPLQMPGGLLAHEPSEVARMSERSVIVVAAHHLVEFLQQLDFPGRTKPWTEIQESEHRKAYGEFVSGASKSHDSSTSD